MESIKEVPAGKSARFERIGSHTYIKGLRLDKKGSAIENRDGMAGSKSSLRYAVGLLSLAAQNAKTVGRGKVTVGRC